MATKLPGPGSPSRAGGHRARLSRPRSRWPGPDGIRPGGLEIEATANGRSALSALGPIGRLGRWTATHVRATAVVWLIVALGLGALAPRAEQALSGAGWEATGSESVRARELIQTEFAGNSSAALVAVSR